MHINVHVRLQYITGICPFLAKLKPLFSQNVSYFSQTFTKLLLLTL